MRYTVLPVLACLLSSASVQAGYQSEDGSAPTLPITLAAGDRVYAATIGSNWSALPQRAHVSYSASGRLQFSGPVYLTGYAEFPGGAFNQFGSPQLLSNQSWFSAPTFGTAYQLTETTGVECCFYHPCQANSAWPYSFSAAHRSCTGYRCGTTQVTDNFEIVDTYWTAPFGTFNGTLSIVDKHGGSTGDNIFWLRGAVTIDGVPRNYYIVFRYAKPGIWLNADTGLPENKFPNDLVDTEVFAGSLPTPLQCRTKFVHHTSSDISDVTPGYIDASDLGMLSSWVGVATCVGYGTTTGCQQFNWFVDLNADGIDIDASDITAFATDLALTDCHDSPAKARDSAAMLEWFGIGLTGRTIAVNGAELPEYDILDPEKNAVAQADPYGYQRRIVSATQIPWTRVKSLYR